MKRSLYLISVVGILIIAGLWAELARPKSDTKEVKAYFADVHGLREGALVEISGVQIGIVKSVKVRGTTGEPVEVIMSLATAYPLEIPSDTSASIHQAGLLGDSIVDLDIKNKHGLPIKRNAILKSVVDVQATPCDIVEKIADLASNEKDDRATKTEAAPKSKAAPGSARKLN